MRRALTPPRIPMPTETTINLGPSEGRNYFGPAARMLFCVKRRIGCYLSSVDE